MALTQYLHPSSNELNFLPSHIDSNQFIAIPKPHFIFKVNRKKVNIVFHDKHLMYFSEDLVDAHGRMKRRFLH